MWMIRFFFMPLSVLLLFLLRLLKRWICQSKSNTCKLAAISLDVKSSPFYSCFWPKRLKNALLTNISSSKSHSWHFDPYQFLFRPLRADQSIWSFHAKMMSILYCVWFSTNDSIIRFFRCFFLRFMVLNNAIAIWHKNIQGNQTISKASIAKFFKDVLKGIGKRVFCSKITTKNILFHMIKNVKSKRLKKNTSKLITIHFSSIFLGKCLVQYSLVWTQSDSGLVMCIHYSVMAII